jgi:hypothetical protein
MDVIQGSHNEDKEDTVDGEEERNDSGNEDGDEAGDANIGDEEEMDSGKCIFVVRLSRLS